jgi:hypothetical protein
MAKQHIPVDLNGFNVRNGIRVSYAVDGIDKQKAQWIHQIPTLKAAVAIAKEFSDEYQDGSSANITRRLDELAPPGSNYHHTGGLTHQWRIFKDGAIQLTTVHRSNKHDINKWLQSIPKPPSHTDNLKTQLYDLRIIADHIGYKDAASIIRRFLPELSTLKPPFITSKIGHSMVFASNEGAMSSPSFEPQQSKESFMSTKSQDINGSKSKAFHVFVILIMFFGTLTTYWIVKDLGFIESYESFKKECVLTKYSDQTIPVPDKCKSTGGLPFIFMWGI